MMSNLTLRKSFQLPLLVLCIVAIAITFNACVKENLEPIELPQKSMDIVRLEIYTNNITSTRNFWGEKIGLEEVTSESSQTKVTYKIGSSFLTFRFFYRLEPFVNHFAISIPPNQIESALTWLKNKDIKIIKNETTVADIYSNPVFNSKSIFFDDAVGNIVELIAFQNLGSEFEGKLIATTIDGPFSKDQLFNISQVSLPGINVRAAYDVLHTVFEYDSLSRSTASYKPTGGPEGLILLRLKSRPWLPTNDNYPPDVPSITTLTIRRPKGFTKDTTITMPQEIYFSNFTLKTVQ
jgi:catechol-2,3-dioxygenase